MPAPRSEATGASSRSDPRSNAARRATAIESLSIERPRRASPPHALPYRDILGELPVHRQQPLGAVPEVRIVRRRRSGRTAMRAIVLTMLAPAMVTGGWAIGAAARERTGGSWMPPPFVGALLDRAGVELRERRDAKAAQSDLSGWWIVTNEIPSEDPGGGESRAYRLHLEHTGATVTGRGVRITANGQPLVDRAPVTVQGGAMGDRLALAFTEQESGRVTRGTFALRMTPDGEMHGTFETDAALPRGRSVARRDPGN
jgi:hypothetical protein